MLSKRKIIFTISFIIFSVCLIILGIDYYYKNTVEVKTIGGMYTEGAVGDFICFNPLFCQNDLDLDVGSLIFSGLGKYNPLEYKIVPDVAEKWSISNDKLTYIFYLRKDVYWHDGTKLTADDVIFTYKNILQSSDINLPQTLLLKNVDIIKIDDFTVIMKLEKPDAFFLKNTTYPLMPYHLLKDIQPTQLIKSAFNLSPIGCGPFKFKQYNKNENSVTLTYFDKHYQKFYIKDIKIYGFKNYIDLFNNIHKLNSIKSIPNEFKNNLPSHFKSYDIEFPQYVALFLNQKNKLLKIQEIRDIIYNSLNIPQIVKIAGENNRIVTNPVFTYEKNNIPTGLIQYDDIIKKINSLGFVKNNSGTYIRFNNITKTQDELYFNLLTINDNIYINVANEIKKELENIGITINVVILDINNFKNSIRNRNYDMLLIGQNIGSDFDLYPYWHSSQAEHPGLNLSMYKNPEVDLLLENIRTEFDGTKHVQMLKYLADRILKDKPIILLYTNISTMVVSDEIKNFNIEFLSSYKDRFFYLNQWYIKTKRTWKNNIIEKEDIVL